MKGSLALAPSTEELLLLSFSFSARVTRKGGTSRRLQGEQPLTVEATRAFENLLLLLLRWCWWCSCHNSCVISVCLCGIIYCDPSGGWKKKKQYLFIIKNRRESGKNSHRRLSITSTGFHLANSRGPRKEGVTVPRT